MKKHRSTPLGDLYSSPPMVESQTTNKSMKRNSSGNGNLKVKCSSINEPAVPSLCVSTLKSPLQSNKEIVDLCNTDPVQTCCISEDQEVPESVHTSQTIIRDPEEDGGPMLMSVNNVDDVDVRNVTREGPTRGSSIEDAKCSVKARNCSAGSSMGTVDCSGRSDLPEASAFRNEKDGDALQNVVHPECSMKQGVSTKKEATNSNYLGLNGSVLAPGCLNSSQKCDVLATNMQASSLPGELIDVRVCDICGDVGKEALLALCSKCSDGAEHIYCMRVKMDTIPDGDWMCEDCVMMQDSKGQPPAVAARLDTASKLSYLRESGKKRSSDMEVRSPSKRRILEGNVRPLKLSGSRGAASLTRATSPRIMDTRKESPSQIYSNDDLSAKTVTEKASSFSGCRSPKPALMNRTLQKNVQPLKSYGSARKTLSTQVSSLKITDKRKIAVLKSSIDDQAKKMGDTCLSPSKKMGETCLSPSSRPAKPQQRIHEGYEELGKGKLFKRSNSSIGVRWPCEDVKSERNKSRESSECQMFVTPKKKLVKSMSFSGVHTPLNTPKSYFAHVSDVKGLKCSGGEKSRKKYVSSERSPRGIMPVARSGAMRIKTIRTTLGSDVKTQCALRNNVEDSPTKTNTFRITLETEISKAPCSSRSIAESMKSIQENDNSNAEALASPGSRKSANTSARSIGENMLSSDAGKETCSSKNACSDVNHFAPLKVELECFSGDDNERLIKKVPLVDSLPIKELPLPLAASVITAVPGSECIWRGAFELEHGGKLPKDCSGIQAHLSTCASSNVLELVHKFQPKILVKQVARLDIWPKQFERNYPTEKDVAIYFFAEDFESYLSNYKGLLDEMMENDLALEANFNGFQFLIFPSSLLPTGSQRWNTLFYLWGVFRVRTTDNNCLKDPGTNAVSLKQGLESLDPLTLPCLESAKTMDHGGENEISSDGKCFPSRETLVCEPVMVEVAGDATEKKCFFDDVPFSDDLQKEDGHIDPSVGCLDKTHIFSYDEPGKDKPVLLSLETGKNGFCSDGNDKHPLASLAWTYSPASKLWPEKRLDVASWSSISVDSGPSGSSDGGGCAKSDEGQVEQLHDPSDHRSVNLDLCLGPGWDSQGQVDLDLVLGLSSSSKYEQNHRPKGISYDKGDISLALTLGMPYSNG